MTALFCAGPSKHAELRVDQIDGWPRSAVADNVV